MWNFQHVSVRWLSRLLAPILRNIWHLVLLSSVCGFYNTSALNSCHWELWQLTSNSFSYWPRHITIFVTITHRVIKPYLLILVLIKSSKLKDLCTRTLQQIYGHCNQISYKSLASHLGNSPCDHYPAKISQVLITRTCILMHP